ncbi:MAG: hypothetical protein V9G29_07790 [Burkholderiaceae bacterium]
MHLPRRFDKALMRAPEACGPVDAALIATLRAWCEGGTVPTLAEPLRAASIAPHAGLDGAACVLDGSQDLARLGRWLGLRWRLQILWREQVAGYGAQTSDPWDCGWWRDGPLGPAEVFRPRRATLMMLREPAPDAASALLATLRAHSPSYTKPLRVLVVSAVPMEGMERL